MKHLAKDCRMSNDVLFGTIWAPHLVLKQNIGQVFFLTLDHFFLTLPLFFDLGSLSFDLGSLFFDLGSLFFNLTSFFRPWITFLTLDHFFWTLNYSFLTLACSFLTLAYFPILVWNLAPSCTFSLCVCVKLCTEEFLTFLRLISTN